MTVLLNTLLEITGYSGLIFLVILTFKKVCCKHISASLNYVIWMLLIIRLLIPFTIDSNFRLIVIPAETTQEVQAKSDAGLEISHSTQSGVAHYVPQPQPEVMQHTLPSNDVISNNVNIPAKTAPAVHIDWKTVIALVWVLGIIGYFAYIITLNIRFRNVMKKSDKGVPPDVLTMVDACKKELGIKADIPVLLQKRMTTPAMTLLLKPMLLLPEGMILMMSRAQVELGIRHELTHYKRRDHLVRLLLLLLRGVYWFNPFFLVAYHIIIADMETACDAHVTARLEKKHKDLYINTIIDIGSEHYIRYALGMGANCGRKSIEKRIRGMYMKKKSNRFAKVSALLMVPLMLIMCFTTACQPTPEDVVVVGKGDGISDLIEATPGASDSVSPTTQSAQTNDALYTKLGAPKHWELETTELGGKLNITADVDIELPRVSQLPAATASLSEFTQEDLDKIADVLGVGDAEWTEVNHTMTKKQIEEGILDYQARRAEFESEGNDEMVAHMDKNIESYKQLYIDAPNEIDLKTIEFKIGNLRDEEEIIGFKGTTKVNNQPFYFMSINAYNSSVVNRVFASYGVGMSNFGGIDIDTPYGISLTKEQAAKQAGEIAKQLTDELSLCYMTPAASGRDERNWGWACVFMRDINGCPTVYKTAERGHSLEAVNIPMNYEKMIIVMDDMGMVSFVWDIPMKIESIDNPDVSLLSFDEISKRATEQIAQRYADWGDPGCTANIVKVELGLMRVDKANSTDYYYIPVWKFFVDTIHTDEYNESRSMSMGEIEMPPGFTKLAEDVYIDENGVPNNINYEYSLRYNVITINAIDGSVIDSGLGY